MIAVEPSKAMRNVLRDAIRAGARPNIEVRDLYWPSLAWANDVDVSFAAHSIYYIRSTAPFLDAMERMSRRTCIAILADQPRGAHLAPVFEAVHGEPFAPLPGLREFVALLSARNRRFEVATVSGEPAEVTSLDEVATLAWRLLWLAPDSPKDQQMRALIEQWWSVPGGVRLPQARGFFGIVAWEPVQQQRG